MPGSLYVPEPLSCTLLYLQNDRKQGSRAVCLPSAAWLHAAAGNSENRKHSAAWESLWRWTHAAVQAAPFRSLKSGRMPVNDGKEERTLKAQIYDRERTPCQFPAKFRQRSCIDALLVCLQCYLRCPNAISSTKENRVKKRFGRLTHSRRFQVSVPTAKATALLFFSAAGSEHNQLADARTILRLSWAMLAVLDHVVFFLGQRPITDARGNIAPLFGFTFELQGATRDLGPPLHLNNSGPGGGIGGAGWGGGIGAAAGGGGGGGCSSTTVRRS
ncbi:hypothetical protein KC342_g32 [Hortaea werneckii]|nr:hypothetical protein KC342_g32 [Hortaea werneckii]